MSIYNEDELEAPKWMNHKFFVHVLQNYENDTNLEVINLKISPASFKGDHFASLMFRAKVEYRKGSDKHVVSRSMIIKTLPEEESFKGQMLMNSQIFETEISMYNEALPKIEKILSDSGDEIRFGPKVIYSSLEPHKMIIFEDLCEIGYDTLRGRQLNMDELKAVLVKLAKIHAVSYKAGQSDHSEWVTKYRVGIFNTPNIFQSDLITSGIKRFKRVLETNDELRVYLPKIEEIEDELQQNCVDLYSAYQNGERDGIFVLNHGDFHLKNLMFKYDKENRYEDVMMVDFQMSVFAPSIIDLVYATFMMFDSEQRLKKRDEIMRFYFDNFIETLTKLHFDGKLPIFGDFQISCLKYKHFSVFLMTTFLPMMVMMSSFKPEDLKDVDVTESFTDPDTLMTLYTSPVFIEELKKLLPDLLNRGYLG